MVAFGYTGWSAVQLDAEIAAGDWQTVPAGRATVFDDVMADKWSNAWARRPKAL